jgi:hypothetical protein
MHPCGDSQPCHRANPVPVVYCLTFFYNGDVRDCAFYFFFNLLHASDEMRDFDFQPFCKK